MPARGNRPNPRGMNDQRDRGRRKKDHRAGQSRRNSHDSEADDFSVFETWLENEFRNETGDRIEPSQSISFKTFLKSAANFDMAPDEKLRILAIHWEDDCMSMDQPRGWNILKRVYQEALKYDSTWGTHYHSMSLSARACAGWLNNSDPQREIIFKEARSICREGLAIVPDNATLHLSIGRCEYDMGNSEVALVHFQDAIGIEPKLMWAILYRAHCLHDLERWADAAEAYEAVDLSYFDRHLQWRADLLRDQLAECYLMSGQREKAMSGFLAVLRHYESNERTLQTPDYLIRAAKGGLRNEIAERTTALLKKEQFFDEAQSVAEFDPPV